MAKELAYRDVALRLDGQVTGIDAVLERLRAERRRQAERASAAGGQLETLRRERSGLERELAGIRERQQRREVDEAENRMRLEAVVERIRTDFDCEPAAALDAPAPEPVEGTTMAGRARDLDRELRLMGPINPLALEEYDALLERHDFLQQQLEDVKNSRRELQRVIKAVDKEIVTVFETAFADVQENFEQLFTTLFPGGSGRIFLTDPEDLLNTGIEMEARPSGKNTRRLSLLSGGERSLTAMAFLFAVFRARPSPFYLLDEVEAALDDVNLHRFLDLVHEFRNEAQLADRVAPEAHDGGRGLPLRRLDGARRVEPRGEPADAGRGRPDLSVLAATAAEQLEKVAACGPSGQAGVALLDRLRPDGVAARGRDRRRPRGAAPRPGDHPDRVRPRTDHPRRRAPGRAQPAARADRRAHLEDQASDRSRAARHVAGSERAASAAGRDDRRGAAQHRERAHLGDRVPHGARTRSA